MPRYSRRISIALLLLGASFPACSDGDARAAERPDAAAKELNKAREALQNWSELKADEFSDAVRRAIDATESRIAELKTEIADSEAAAEARERLARLEQQRDDLAARLDRLGEATAEEAEDAKQAIVDGVNDFHDRLSSAWEAFKNG